MNTPETDANLIRRTLSELVNVTPHDILATGLLSRAQSAMDALERIVAALPDDYAGCMVAGAEDGE